MPKRPGTVETVLLALEILKRIPRPGKISAPELHAQLTGTQFARDLRTIQRQLDMLSQHFDIERDDRSRPYGYRWKERAKAISLPSLTAQEALLLALAKEQLRNLLPASLAKSMARLFDQADQILGPNSRATAERAWLSKVRIVSETQPLIAPKIEPKMLDAVSEALFHDKVLAVKYRNAQGKAGVFEVMPLGIAQQGSRLYLVCRFEGFDDERTLALHRLVSAEVQERGFARPTTFDLQKYDDEGRFGFGEGKQVRLKFRIPKEEGSHLLESPLSTNQVCRDLGDQLEFTATVTESARLIWWLRHFGRSLEVLSPSRIAKAV